jgi:UDP-N-acetylmuramate--alanine ligase
VTEAFAEFASTISSDGFLVYCADDKGSAHLGQATAKLTKSPTLISYGVTEGADLRLDQISLLPMGASARVLWKGRAIGSLTLAVPGHHNLLNAAACLAMGLCLGAPAAELLSGLHSFRGAGRRFEVKATVHGIRVVDDYGHHPTEIKVTLTAAKHFAGDGRVLVIFQPHRYSRTQAFLNDFAKTLDIADEVVMLEIYAASEKEIPGISAELITDQMKNGHFIPNFVEASDWMIDNAKTGDVIVTLGAGDVNSLAPIIVEGLTRRFSV